MGSNLIKIFYVEGENEEHFLRHASSGGRIKRFNFWQQDVKKIIRRLNQNYCVTIIFDTDAIGDNELRRFFSNIQKLDSICHRVTLLQQSKNFEDELIYSCQRKKKDLFDRFNAKSHKEFKRNFNGTTNVMSVLDQLGFDRELMWSKPIIKELKALNRYMNKEKINKILDF